LWIAAKHRHKAILQIDYWEKNSYASLGSVDKKSFEGNVEEDEDKLDVRGRWIMIFFIFYVNFYDF
jgi:hypothetical protein